MILKVYFEGERYAGFDLIPTHVNRDGRVFVAALDEAAEVLERTRQASQSLGMQEWQPEYIANLPEADLAGLSQEEITRQLFEQWLDYSVSPILPNSARIGVYEIESISVGESQQEQASELGMDWLAEVVFAVRPVVPHIYGLGFRKWRANPRWLGAPKEPAGGAEAGGWSLLDENIGHRSLIQGGATPGNSRTARTIAASDPQSESRSPARPRRSVAPCARYPR